MPNTPNLRPVLAVHLCVLALTTSSQAQPLSPPVSLRLPTSLPAPNAPRTKALPPGSPPVTNVFTRTTSTPNCLASAFDMPGQAWHTDLTGGGISLNASTPTNPIDARPPTFETLYGFPPEWLDERVTNSEIMIVDHFAFTPVNLLTERGPDTLMLNHGALVEAHLRAILESAGFTPRSYQPLKYGRGDRTVTLTRKDLNSDVYRTKSLTGNAPVPSAALAQALQKDLKPNGKSLIPPDLVLNMSFSMIPCQAMTTYRTIKQTWANATPPQPYNLNTFLQDVAQENNLTLTQVQRELTTVNDTEPLKQTLTTLTAERRAQGSKITTVASSGNFGLPYPTAPAAFPQVISAGMLNWQGQPAQDNNGSIWPSAASVNIPGEWFTLTNQQLQQYCQEGKTCVTNDLQTNPERYTHFAYRGTSFAAPTLSLFLALQQGPGNKCFTQSGTGYAPISKTTTTKPINFQQLWQHCENQ